MTPTKKQWKAILKEVRQLQKKEMEIDLMLNNYLKEINPSVVPTLLPNYILTTHEKGMVHGFVCAIEAAYGKIIADELHYFLYQVPSVANINGKCVVKDKEGNTYDANNIESYVSFLIATYD